jgi:hypothetical protein
VAPSDSGRWAASLPSSSGSSSSSSRINKYQPGCNETGCFWFCHICSALPSPARSAGDIKENGQYVYHWVLSWSPPDWLLLLPLLQMLQFMCNCQKVIPHQWHTCGFSPPDWLLLLLLLVASQ